MTMARKFRKKAGLGIVSLPGLPGLGNDTVVEGDEYARFCPAILEEVPADTPVTQPPVKAAPVTLPEDEEEDVEPEPPNMEWLKGELVEYAEALGLNVEGKTKRQILDAIQAEEAEES